MTNAGISPGLFRDLFVALGESVEGEVAWSVRIQYKPLVRWLWLGALMMAAGGAFAVSDKRYRVRQRRTVTADEKSRSPSASPAGEATA